MPISRTFPDRGLYAITDGPRPDLLDACTRALAGGARILQYRDKTTDDARRHAEASALLELCTRHGIPLVINDDVVLALTIGAHGVHLGEHDGSLAAARSQLGRDAIIGVSCYDSLALARQAAESGASYVAFGAFFASPTKPLARRASIELLRQSAALGLPRVAIGGITPDNGASLVEAGADYLAVISAVFGSPDVRASAQCFASLYPSREQA